MATNTPWGLADSKIKYCTGINSYTTSGHGGYKISAKLNLEIPAYMRNADGWYEEDCEWCKPIIIFKDRHPDLAAKYDAALLTFKRWFPNEYECYTGIDILPGDSHVRDEAIFLQRNLGNYVIRAAWGAWCATVPEGCVGVAIGRITIKNPAEFVRYALMPRVDYDGMQASFNYWLLPGALDSYPLWVGPR